MIVHDPEQVIGKKKCKISSLNFLQIFEVLTTFTLLRSCALTLKITLLLLRFQFLTHFFHTENFFFFSKGAKGLPEGGLKAPLCRKGVKIGFFQQNFSKQVFIYEFFDSVRHYFDRFS